MRLTVIYRLSLQPLFLKKGDYFTLTLEKRQAVQEIRIVFDVSKEHPNMYNYLSARTVQYLRK